MSLVNFICPDGGRIPAAKCLEPGGCRMKERCATRPYLKMAASERSQLFRCRLGHELRLPATNRSFSPICPRCHEVKVIAPMEYVPSTTQLIAGTKQAFLKLTSDFDISPDSRAFMITGTKGHSAMEGSEDDMSLIEEKFTDEDVTGIADLLTIEDGETVLSDYKVTGSYKVAKALGFTTVDEPTGEIFKSGKNKGKEKTRKVLKRTPDATDNWDWAMQLNKYRMNFEKRGFKVDRLKIQAIVRDGNTYTARSRGVFRNVYYFDIPMMEDAAVEEYFERKRRDLLQALRQGYWTELCDNKENWDGVKCSAYCEVADSCPLGKYLKQDKQTEEGEMPITGLSDTRRLPRMGKIRLGIMVEKPGKAPYPKEVKHFILDPAVENELEKKRLIEIFHQKYGPEPTSIDIMFPVADQEQIFPQYYKSYGKSTMLNCKGDGITAETNNPEYIKNLEKIGDGEFGTKVKCAGRECPYYLNKQCSEAATLSVLLPELPGSGVWQITTGSIHSILNLNSCFDYIRAIAGRFHMLPLKLERRTQEVAHEGKKTKHYCLHINLELTLAALQRRALIDPVKAAMQLPPVDDERKDLHFKENIEINKDVQEAQLAEQQPAPAVDPTTDPDPGPDSTPPKAEDLPPGEPVQGWDDEPTPEQADLGLKIEAAIHEAQDITQLKAVKSQYAAQMKDPKALTVRQKEVLNGFIKDKAIALNKQQAANYGK